MKKVLLFTFAVLFALVAKAALTIEPIEGEDMAFTMTVTDPGKDLGPAANWTADKVFYTENGNEVKAGQVKKLIVTTDAGDKKLGNGEFKTFKESFTSLSYLDLENSAVDNAAFGGNDKYLNAMSQLRTLVFPKANGLVIPASAFENNQYLETVIFPDRPDSESGGTGTYEIMAYAFRNSAVKTVSLGKGYHITDFDSDQTSSGVSIFEHCTNLTNVVLDNSITQLGVKAFSATYNLKYLVLPEELINIGSLCFKECGIETVTIPDHVVLVRDAQIFQGCIYLKNVFVNSDNVVAPYQALMEENQTTNFKWKQGVTEQTYSTDDYTPQAIYNSSDDPNCPFKGQPYTIPILHYPGTNTGIENYRTPYYMQYSGIDPVTGTTWPNADDFANIYSGIRPAWDAPEGDIGIPSFGSDWVNNKYTPYSGWKQFYIGNNTFKEQKVFYDERIKESRWYSICLPINMTEAQFMNAYGVKAELKEFSGAVYDENEKMIILNFDKDATVDKEGPNKGYLLKKNVPYMIHPADIKLSKVKMIEFADMQGGVKFITETVNGQEQYKTKEAIATFDVESDIFINWEVLKAGAQALNDRVAEILDNTDTDLAAKAVTKALTVSSSNPDNIPPHNYTFRGSIDGATVAAPGYNGQEAQVRITRYPTSSLKIPAGAYYLGYDPDHGVNTPQFFKSRGIATWSPYCALIEATDPDTSSAKEFDTLEIDFNGLSDNIVVTGIGKPTIQIPVMNTNDKVYNLNGQVVRENSKGLNGLKGIFIVGGKKVVIK